MIEDFEQSELAKMAEDIIHAQEQYGDSESAEPNLPNVCETGAIPEQPARED